MTSQEGQVLVPRPALFQTCNSINIHCFVKAGIHIRSTEHSFYSCTARAYATKNQFAKVTASPCNCGTLIDYQIRQEIWLKPKTAKLPEEDQLIRGTIDLYSPQQHSRYLTRRAQAVQAGEPVFPSSLEGYEEVQQCTLR